MHVNASRIFPTAALLFVSVSLIAQQAAAPSQSTASATKKHLAGVKYESMTVQRSDQNPPKPQPSPAPADVKRKDGAIVAADFNKRESGVPLKGVGTAGHAQAPATADKGIGSAGLPGKAASPNEKAQGAPLKGVGHKQDTPKN